MGTREQYLSPFQSLCFFWRSALEIVYKVNFIEWHFKSEDQHPSRDPWYHMILMPVDPVTIKTLDYPWNHFTSQRRNIPSSKTQWQMISSFNWTSTGQHWSWLSHGTKYRLQDERYVWYTCCTSDEGTEGSPNWILCISYSQTLDHGLPFYKSQVRNIGVRPFSSSILPSWLNIKVTKWLPSKIFKFSS